MIRQRILGNSQDGRASVARFKCGSVSNNPHVSAGVVGLHPEQTKQQQCGHAGRRCRLAGRCIGGGREGEFEKSRRGLYAPDRLLLDVRAPLSELLEKAFIHEDEVLDGRLIVSRLPPFADDRQSRINPADACPGC